jgi:CRP/FNR family transcriptional regulator, cyclic AMP receptor protein
VPELADVQDRYTALLRKAGESEELSAGEAVFLEGEPAERMYVVDSGSVSLMIGDRVLEIVGPGGVFGELAVIDRAPRSASAVAAADTTLVAIDKRRFWFLVQETPYFAQIVMRLMADRLRRETARTA